MKLQIVSAQVLQMFFDLSLHVPLASVDIFSIISVLDLFSLHLLQLNIVLPLLAVKFGLALFHFVF